MRSLCNLCTLFLAYDKYQGLQFFHLVNKVVELSLLAMSLHFHNIAIQITICFLVWTHLSKNQLARTEVLEPNSKWGIFYPVIVYVG